MGGEVSVATHACPSAVLAHSEWEAPREVEGPCACTPPDLSRVCLGPSAWAAGFHGL